MSSIRNIAIIAHVDHGKTTLVDQLIYAAKTLEKKEGEKRIMDSNELEKERGITITSKNVAINYKDTKINVIDTPGHADFGGEVERVLRMADGVVLLVDAFEGVMPQTRFVLQKAVEIGLKLVLVINKIDKPNGRPEEIPNEVVDLMFHLDATEEQLEFPIVYGSAKEGWMTLDPKVKTENVFPLLNTVLDYLPAPEQRKGVPQFQVTSLAYSHFTGRIAIGRVYQGVLQEGKEMLLCQGVEKSKKVTIKELHVFEGLNKKRVKEVEAGDICAVTGLEDFQIGDTLTDLTQPAPLPRIAVDEPTMSMLFAINDSPFNGREGKFVTSTHLRNRLLQEVERNLALKVEKTSSEDRFLVYGRGILHLAILIETMSREGYELQLGQPQILFKEEAGKKCEPIEHLTVDVPEVFSGKVIDLLTKRKGDLLLMEPKGDEQHLAFEVPSRGLIGLRNTLLTLTGGKAIMNHAFKEYQPYKGDIPGRINGSLISMEAGIATPYAMSKLQDRGIFFIPPGTEVYKGQVIGEHSRPNDLHVNVIKGKKLTNMRASGSDEGIKLPPPKIFSLEEGMEYIQKDEYLEVTPKAMRLRKIQLKR